MYPLGGCFTWPSGNMLFVAHYFLWSPEALLSLTITVIVAVELATTAFLSQRNTIRQETLWQRRLRRKAQQKKCRDFIARPKSHSKKRGQRMPREICSVCLCPLMDVFVASNGLISKLSCDHVFHSKCIREWAERSNDCPLCRKWFYL